MKKNVFENSEEYNKSTKQYHFKSIASILTIIFVTLKLTGTIAWSWWWVFSPIIIKIGLVLLLLILIIIIMILSVVFKKC